MPDVDQILQDLKLLGKDVLRYSARIKAGDSCPDILTHASAAVERLRRVTRFFLLEQLRTDMPDLPEDGERVRQVAAAQLGLHRVVR